MKNQSLVSLLKKYVTPIGLLVMILSIGVLIRVAVSLVMGDRVEILPGIYDQVSYNALAQNVLTGNGFAFSQDWWPVTRAFEPTAHWSYAMTLYLVGVYRIFGYHPLAAPDPGNRCRYFHAMAGLSPGIAHVLQERSNDCRRGHLEL